MKLPHSSQASSNAKETTLRGHFASAKRNAFTLIEMLVVISIIATKDLALTAASDPRAQAVLADIWWDLGERAKSTSYREPCRQRAAYWYQQAYERLPDSLDRIHVKSRIEEAEAQEGGNPVALCSQLAREMGVSLANPRAQLIPNLRVVDNDDDED